MNERRENDIAIFGVNAEARFNKYLTNLLEKMASDVSVSAGGAVKNFGSHSFRKGSVTLVCGVTCGPNQSAIDDRAG